MGKSNQSGKNHKYPTQRKPYLSSRKGIGGRKKTAASNATSTPTYFDRQLEKQRNLQQGNVLFLKDIKYTSQSI